MKALIVFDSFFGNTEKIARAVAAGMEAAGMEAAETQVCKAAEVSPQQVSAADLVVVGSPTRAFRPTKPVQELVKTIAVSGKRVAAFDTRADVKEVNNAFLTFMVKIFGYAAEPIARGLQKRGGSLAAPAEGFFVNGSEGPLKDGELERAVEWGRKLAA